MRKYIMKYRNTWIYNDTFINAEYRCNMVRYPTKIPTAARLSCFVQTFETILKGNIYYVRTCILWNLW